MTQYLKGLCLDDEHFNRLNDLLKRDGTYIKDTERIALFYILGAVEKFYKVSKQIYDFNDHSINLDIFERVDFSSGERKLLILGFNLYNSYKSEVYGNDVMSLFSGLDEDNFTTAIRAVHIRFNR